MLVSPLNIAQRERPPLFSYFRCCFVEMRNLSYCESASNTCLSSRRRLYIGPNASCSWCADRAALMHTPLRPVQLTSCMGAESHLFIDSLS
jgi:hypothetical protein